MTIPDIIIFPEYPPDGIADPSGAVNHNQAMVRALTRSYEDIANGINGSLKNSIQGADKPFIPTVSGTTVAAGASVTYSGGGHQFGWVLRQGIYVDVWYDVSWTAAVGHTGTLYVDLPYQVATQTSSTPTEKPFVGSVQCSNITFTGSYCVCNAIPDSRRCEIWTVGSGIATAGVAFDTVGQVIGHVRYVGKQIERD